jgi:ATP-dependent Clp protease ATP-binding subunit ClpA
MYQRFAKDAKAIVSDASAVARELASPTVEAEHLLLAVARSGTPAAAALADHGLDFAGLEAALERETERSLAAVGVAAEAGRFSPWAESPHFATSSKLALQRALRVAAGRRDRHLAPGHVALGVLSANFGTVPRALAIAEVDRAALTDALAATLS